MGEAASGGEGEHEKRQPPPSQPWTPILTAPQALAVQVQRPGLAGAGGRARGAHCCRMDSLPLSSWAPHLGGRPRGRTQWAHGVDCTALAGAGTGGVGD